MVLAFTRRSDEILNLSSQLPQSLISGTIVELQRLSLNLGWIFKILTSGLRIVFLFSGVRIYWKL